jgi:hypothetical protein
MKAVAIIALILSVWNVGAVFIIASHYRRHHHGGFTHGNRVMHK